MELKYLLDSNAIIDYLGGKIKPSGMSFLNNVIDNVPIISVISKIEILSYQTIESEYNLLKNFCNDAIIVDLNDEIVNKTITLRLQYKMKTPDAIIAATSIIYNLTLITRNTSDFGKIQGLQFFNAWDV